MEDAHTRIEMVIRTDRRVKICEIVGKLATSKSTVGQIIRDDLKFGKVCAQWVPKQLTPQHKDKR